MSSLLQDLGIDPSTFSASLIETPGAQHTLTVKGVVVGDYRVQDVHLVPAHHHGPVHILVLDVTAKLGPVEKVHPDFERVWPLQYKENPARHTYTEVKIVNGGQHFTINVVAAL